MSIDDVTIMMRLPEGMRVRIRPVVGGGRVREGTLRNKQSGERLDYKMVHRAGMILKYVPETRDVYVTLSAPRIVGNQNYNYPLRRVEDARVFLGVRVASFLIDALGLPRPEVRPGYSAADPRDALPVPLDRWIVVKVAYALDLDVGDGGLIETLRAFSTLPRENAGQGTDWKRRNTITGVQWGSVGSSRLMVYSKGAEIRRQCPRIRRVQDEHGQLDEDRDRERELRRELAESARNVIRFETTLDGVAAVREPFGMPSPTTPTLRLMAQERVQQYVLGRELRRLRLLQLHEVEPPTQEDDMPDAVNLLREVCRAARAYNSGPERVRRRPRMSLARVYMLAMFYVTEGRVERKQVVEWFGGGESTLKSIAADLRLLRLPPLSDPSLEPHQRLRIFMDAVRRQVPAFPNSLPELDADAAYARGLVADAPWAEEIQLIDDEPGISIDRDDDELAFMRAPSS